MPTPHSIRDSVFHLDGAGLIPRRTNEPRFWQARTRPELCTGQLLSAFTYSTTWDYQERHPDGDELAVVLAGIIDLLIDNGDGETATRLEPEAAGVIPTGAWHRVAIHDPATILFITPVPSRTEHRMIDTARPPNLEPSGQRTDSSSPLRRS